MASQRAASPLAEVAARVRAECAPDAAWILVGPYRSWMHFAVDRPCLSAREWDALEDVRSASARRADVLVAPDRLWPADGASDPWREVGRWELDGDGWHVAVRAPASAGT